MWFKTFKTSRIILLQKDKYCIRIWIYKRCKISLARYKSILPFCPVQGNGLRSIKQRVPGQTKKAVLFRYDGNTSLHIYPDPVRNICNTCLLTEVVFCISSILRVYFLLNRFHSFSLKNFLILERAPAVFTFFNQSCLGVWVFLVSISQNSPLLSG